MNPIRRPQRDYFSSAVEVICNKRLSADSGSGSYKATVQEILEPRPDWSHIEGLILTKEKGFKTELRQSGSSVFDELLKVAGKGGEHAVLKREFTLPLHYDSNP